MHSLGFERVVEVWEREEILSERSLESWVARWVRPAQG